MSTDIPAGLLLAHVLRAVAAWLPEHYGVLLAAGRFADGRAALSRVADADGAAAATSSLPPGEASRLLDAVLRRWAALGAVDVPPLAVILPPGVGEPAYRLAVHGADDGWTASWSGPVQPTPDGRAAAPTGEPGRVGARVFARAAGARTVLGAVLAQP